MKRTIGFFFFVVVVACCAEPTRTEVPSDDHVYSKVSIKNTVYGNSFVDGECKCCHLFGKRLKKCLSSLDQEELCKHFIALNARRIKQFLLSLSLPEYKEFLSIWTDEQWQEMVEQLNDSQKTVIPATKQELVNLVEKVEAFPWLELVKRGGSFAVKNGLPVAFNPNPFVIGAAIYNALQEVNELTQEDENKKEEVFEQLKHQFYCQGASR